MYTTKSHSYLQQDDSADIVYYNIVMTCPTALSNTLASYQETRTQPIIDNPNDYYMSIVRFSIDGSNIPIFVCPVIPNPSNANDVNFTPFQVTLSYGGVNYTQNLIFIPESDAPAPLPPSAEGLQDFINYYYYIYYYSTLVNMINNALSAAFTALVAANAGLSPTVQAPYFIYDRVLQKFALVVQNVTNPLVGGTNVYLTQFNSSGVPLLGANQVAGTIEIFLNSRIYSYFDGLEVFYLNTANSNLMIIRDTKNDYYYPPQNAANTAATQVPVSLTSGTEIYTTQPQYFSIYQQYSTISLWNSLSSLVFLTSTIPVQNEYIPASAINSMQTSGFAAFRPIITDFVPDLSAAGDPRTRFNYYPQGPYRLIELKSNEPLRRIDLQIFWQDQYQNLFPLNIACNEADTIKIMFMRKSLAKYSNQSSH